MSPTTPSTPEERRAKRQLRREMQRAANVGRAAKMHDARVEWERQTESSFSSTSATPPPLQIGCSGWFYWHWRDVIYPPGLPTRDWFRHYTGILKTVELNAPFYSWPTVTTVKTWLRQVGRRNFIYTVKASELITHVKQFLGTRTLVKDFGHIADLLGSRMGCFLFQLPPSFNFTPARLARIVSQMDPTRRNVVEFRHKSWWNEKVYITFRKAGVIFCSCSAPRLPDELVKTADEIYIRFHGIKQWYRHDYTREELGVWTQRIRASGAKRIWAYFNNDRNGFAVKNAKEFHRQLRTAI